MILDEKTLENFKSGKLAPFYRHAYGSLLSYATRILGENNAFMAEDCVQDVIIKTYELRYRIHQPEQWKSMLYTLIHNKCVSLLRKQSSHADFLSSSSQENNNEVELDMGQKMIEQETLDALFTVINRLPDRLRKIFELSFEEGLKNEKVAETIGISVSRVKQQKKQLIDTLRQQLDPGSMVCLLVLFPNP